MSHDYTKNESGEKKKVKPTLYFFPEEKKQLEELGIKFGGMVKPKSLASTIEIIVRDRLNNFEQEIGGNT